MVTVGVYDGGSSERLPVLSKNFKTFAEATTAKVKADAYVPSRGIPRYVVGVILTE